MTYLVLPINFQVFDNENLFITNDAGEYYFLKIKDFDSLLSYNLEMGDSIYQDLKSKQFVADSDFSLPIELLATKYRTKNSYLLDFTSLHMMVVTVRCNHDCKYCQVSSVSEDAHKFDMSPETAERIVDIIFCSPSKQIKIEFQGGEPLINWKTIKKTVEYAEIINKRENKKLEFVICTNLSIINDEQLNFIREHDIYISTSLDGGKKLHDENRKLRISGSSYDLLMEKLDLTRKYISNDKISALLTITNTNIDSIREIIDEYIRIGFNGIFFRALNPYGSAHNDLKQLGYPINKFLKAYETGLDYIIELNSRGKFFIEYYTALLLKRILTPFSTGFVDLQSPSGAGISGVIYDYNGDVYPADEARMLARMGNTYFKMGNVFEQSYLEIFYGKVIKEIVKKSILDLMPCCFSCVYKPYCGADPIRNYLETNDIYGHRPTSDFCKKHNGIFKIIFKKLLENDPDVINVFWSWVTQGRFRGVKREEI